MTDPDLAPVLIVEDEPKLASVLADYFQASGYHTHHLLRGDDVVPWLEQNEASIMLLDLMLGGMDGLEVCRRVRAITSLPIIIMTARTEEIDRLLGFGLGADDYVCKPYSPREMVARVQAILKRVKAVEDVGSTQNYRGVVLNESAYSCEVQGQKVALTPVEFRMLLAMAIRPGQVMRREQLCAHAYDDNRIVSVPTINTHIKNLRKKLNDVSTDGDLIHSVYGVGYKLE